MSYDTWNLSPRLKLMWTNVGAIGEAERWISKVFVYLMYLLKKCPTVVCIDTETSLKLF